MARTKQTAQKYRKGETPSAQDKAVRQKLLNAQKKARGEGSSARGEESSATDEGSSEDSMADVLDLIHQQTEVREPEEEQEQVVDEEDQQREPSPEPTMSEDLRAWIKMHKKKKAKLAKWRAAREERKQAEEEEKKRKIKGKDKAVPKRKLKNTPTGIVIREREPDQPPSSSDDDDDEAWKLPRNPQEDTGSPSKPTGEDEVVKEQGPEAPPPYPTWAKAKDPKKPIKPARESYILDHERTYKTKLKKHEAFMKMWESYNTYYQENKVKFVEGGRPTKKNTIDHSN